MEPNSETANVKASPAQIMAVIGDIETYSQWNDDVKTSTALTKNSDGRPETARFHVESGPVKDTYDIEYEWNGDESVSWKLIESKAFRQFEGSYTLAAKGDGTDVTYEMAMDVNFPMPGFIKRKSQKSTVSRGLKSLKTRCEQG